MDKARKTSSRAPADRRVQKTRKLLSDALVALILEKGYASVSIQDIVAKANVGRSTFYLHYENKEQLLLWGHDHIKNLILEEGTRRIRFADFYRHLADAHVLAHAVLSQESGRAVTRFLVDILKRNILRLHPASGSREERKVHALRAEATAAALVQLMTAWLREGMPAGPARLAEESEALLAKLFP